MASKASLTTRKRRAAGLQAALYHARQRRMERQDGGGEVTPVSSKFNTTNNVHGAFSNDDLTFTASAAQSSGAMAVKGNSTGKRMVSFAISTPTDITATDYVGVGPSDFSLADVNGGAIQVIMLPTFKSYSEGQVADDATGGDWPGYWAHETRLDLVIDFDTGKFFYRYNLGDWNGSGTANPSTGAGGHSMSVGTVGKTLYPVVRLADNTEHVTINTQPDELPSGVTAWG